MAYWARSGVWSLISAPIHSPLACGASGAWLQRPPLPNCGPKSALWIWSNWLISRQASSPTVPETSIFRRSVAISLTVREPAVEHEINQDAGYAHVHPERPSPSGDGAMTIIAAPQPPAQRND